MGITTYKECRKEVAQMLAQSHIETEIALCDGVYMNVETLVHTGSFQFLSSMSFFPLMLG